LYDCVYYDGAKIFARVGSLVNGDMLLLTKSNSKKDKGVYENYVEFIIVDEYGNDITHYYNITTEFGTVNIYEKVN
jgi:hypothetical protein